LTLYGTLVGLASRSTVTSDENDLPAPRKNPIRVFDKYVRGNFQKPRCHSRLTFNTSNLKKNNEKSKKFFKNSQARLAKSGCFDYGTSWRLILSSIRL